MIMKKLPKKLKYSKPYSKQQIKKMQECTDYFISEIAKLRKIKVYG